MAEARQLQLVTSNVDLPLGGLVMKGNIADLNPKYAMELTNFLPPDGDTLEMRPGYGMIENSGMAFEGDVVCGSMFSYVFGNQSSVWRTIVDSNNNIYLLKNDLDGGPCQDVTPGDGIEDIWLTSACFANRLFILDGYKLPLVYNPENANMTRAVFYKKEDGEIKTPLENLYHPAAFANRLFFAQLSTLNVYYGDVFKTEGPVGTIDLNMVSRKGGSVSAIFAYSQNFNDTMYQYLCFLTSCGEVIMYTGDDPSDDNRWRLAGVYETKSPINEDCFKNTQDDVIIFSSCGPVSLKKIITGASDEKTQNLEDACYGFFSGMQINEKNATGFCLHYDKQRRWLIFNAPDTLGGTYSAQLVFNEKSATWAKFTNVNARRFVSVDSRLAFSRYLTEPFKSMNYDGSELWELKGVSDGKNLNDEPLAIQARFRQGFFYLSDLDQKFIREANIFTTYAAQKEAMLLYSIDFKSLCRSQNINRQEEYGSVGFLYWDSPAESRMWDSVIYWSIGLDDVAKSKYLLADAPFERISLGYECKSSVGCASICAITLKYLRGVEE
jgi:hypothetical protein